MDNIEVVETATPFKNKYVSSDIDWKNNKITIYNKDVLHAIKLEVAKATLQKMRNSSFYRFINNKWAFLPFIVGFLGLFMLTTVIDIQFLDCIPWVFIFALMAIMVYSEWVDDKIRERAFEKVTGAKKKKPAEVTISG